MKTNFVYPKPFPRLSWPLMHAVRIGEMIRTAIKTGITPDMPSAEISDDNDDKTFDNLTDDRVFVDPLGNIRTDWVSYLEKNPNAEIPYRSPKTVGDGESSSANSSSESGTDVTNSSGSSKTED